MSSTHLISHQHQELITPQAPIRNSLESTSMRTSALIPLQGRRRLSGRNYAALIPRSVQPLQRSGGTSLVRSHPIPSPIQRRSYHPSITLLSDNLLGYSPMAQSLPKSNDTGKQKSAQSPSQGAMWGVDSNTAGGGVWAQSSAKKDKLNELLTDLNGEGIDTGKLGEFRCWDLLRCHLL